MDSFKTFVENLWSCVGNGCIAARSGIVSFLTLSIITFFWDFPFHALTSWGNFFSQPKPAHTPDRQYDRPMSSLTSNSPLASHQDYMSQSRDCLM
jgi:hypothetical protein